MNKITLLNKTSKVIINIPPYNGLASIICKYNHNITRPVKKVIKINLVVELWLKEEFTGNYLHKLMPMKFEYRINLEGKLLPSDLAKIWHQSGTEAIKAFNDFERNQFGKESPIFISSEEEFLTMVQPVMDWYNSLSPDN